MAISFNKNAVKFKNEVGEYVPIDAIGQQIYDDSEIKAELVTKADKTEIPTIPESLPANGGNADTVDGKHASDFQSVTNPSSSGTYTHEGKINVTKNGDIKAQLFADAEGGNLQLTSPNADAYVQMDLYNNTNFRIYGAYSGSAYRTLFSYNFTTNEATIDGTDLYHLRTLNSSGAGYGGSSNTLYAQYNVHSDNRFKLRMSGGHAVRTDYATASDTVDGYHFNSGTSASPSGAAGTIYFQYS